MHAQSCSTHCDPMDCNLSVSSVGFSRQEYWNGFPFPPPGNLPDPGIQPLSLALTGGFFTPEPPGKPYSVRISVSKNNIVLITCLLLMTADS